MMNVVKERRPKAYVGRLALLLALTGCIAGSDANGPNLVPESLEEAEETLAYLDARLDANPDDSEAREMLAMLRLRLDDLNHLVARVDMGGGREVRFYEVEPGVVGVTERAPEGEALLLGEETLQLSLTELYEQLANAPAPLALVDAQLREEALRELVNAEEEIEPFESAGAEDPQSELLPEGVGVSRSALTGSHGTFFRDNYCFTGGEFRGCHPNDGGNVYAMANTRTSFFTVAPYDGDVSVRLSYEGTLRFTDAVFNGEVRSFWWRSSSYRRNGVLPFSPRQYRRRHHRWQVTNASGDRFHWSYAFRWNCDYRVCDGFPR